MECYCDQSQPFEQCCGRYLEQAAFAPDPVSLMRSRYSAFVTLDETYLLDTWHPKHKPKEINFDRDQNWIGLKIHQHSQDQTQGFVKFTARYKLGGRGFKLEEHSEFTFIDGRWYYLQALR